MSFTHSIAHEDKKMAHDEKVGSDGVSHEGDSHPMKHVYVTKVPKGLVDTHHHAPGPHADKAEAHAVAHAHATQHTKGTSHDGGSNSNIAHKESNPVHHMH